MGWQSLVGVPNSCGGLFLLLILVCPSVRCTVLAGTGLGRGLLGKATYTAMALAWQPIPQMDPFFCDATCGPPLRLDGTSWLHSSRFHGKLRRHLSPMACWWCFSLAKSL